MEEAHFTGYKRGNKHMDPIITRITIVFRVYP
jgi:hypothetical protein